jgi:pSer/pThr/pTyr-binding forkhead associated (FHA) protein
MPELARLSWLNAKGEPCQATIEKELTIIGRGRDCDIVLLDERVSRQHTEIHLEEGIFLVSDLGSFNGTQINGDFVEGARPINSGDQLQVGPVRLSFDVLIPTEKNAPSTKTRHATLVVPEETETPYLELLSGPQKGLRFSLVKDKITIGRGGRKQSWDIMLQDRAVSRPHAQIVRRADECILTDLDSANGTLINGARIQASEALEDGDVLQFGEHPLVYRTSGGER